MQITLYIVGLFLLGYVAKHKISDVGQAVKWMNNFIIYLAMPSIILLKIPTLEFNSQMFIPAAYAWGWGLVGGLTMLGVSKVLRFPKPLEGAAILLAILGNTSFLGYPMVQAYFNDDVLNYAIIYDQLGGFLMLSTIGVIVISVYSPTHTKSDITLNTIAKRVVKFPPFIALVVAGFLPVDALVDSIEPVLVLTGKSLMPMALIVIGLQFQPQLLPDHRLPLASAIGVKMVMAPLLAYVILSYFETGNAVMQATVFEAAMPCMITPGIMAMQAGLAPRFCATLLGYSTLFAFAWLPLTASFLQ